MTRCLSVPEEDAVTTMLFPKSAKDGPSPCLFNIIIDISRMISHSFIALSALTQTPLFQTISTL